MTRSEELAPAIVGGTIFIVFLFYMAFLNRYCLDGILYDDCETCPHVTFYEYMTGQYQGPGGNLDEWGHIKRGDE